MDILPTQIFEENDFTPTQRFSDASQDAVTEEDVQVGILKIGLDTYPIKKGINKIGRHPACNIVLKDQTVSKQHAEIEANSRETSAWICDLNSSNKTKLNDSALRPGRCYELKDGSIVEFGTVKAMYKVHRLMDESLIPETPAPARQKKQQLVIPGTPDSSLNNSSTLGENISMIPSTQTGDNEEAVFRRPSVPLRTSTSSGKRSFVQDSSIDDSSDDSTNLSVQGKENVGEQGVSIHDMETQKSFELPSESDASIHDVETQKIGVSDVQEKSNHTIHRQSDIHDLETQHTIDEEASSNVTDIHDMETQHDIDIHDMKTPRRSNRQNVTASDADDSVRNVDKSNAEVSKLTKQRINDISNTEDQQLKSSSDKAAKQENTKHTEIVQTNSEEYLQLSQTTNFEDECSELDRSRNLLGSPNLLQDFIDVDDEPPDESISTASTPRRASRLNENNETTEKSTDEENIFDAATQVKNDKDENMFNAVTQRVKYKFKASLMEDDSDETTDGEGVFLRYSRVDEKANQNSQKSQTRNSDESDTDEEGRFTEIALKEKQVASTSFESRQNQRKDTKDDAGSSRDSDDLFEVATQPVNTKNQESSAQLTENNELNVNFDAPTQTIGLNMNVKTLGDVVKLSMSEHDKDVEVEEIDDMEPTQVLPTRESSAERNDFSVNSKNKPGSSKELEDITEMEDDTATQILSNPEKDSDIGNVNDELIPNLLEECSVEDIDYEMAPTQLISEIDKRKSVSLKNSAKKTSKIPKSSDKVNLDDTVERNLNEMFDDVNENNIDEQPQISTQVLQNMLISSQCEDKLTGSDEQPSNNAHDYDVPIEKYKIKISVRERKSNKGSTDNSDSHSVTNSKSQRSSLKNTNTAGDSQNTENYFSNLTSIRKRNVLVDSQEMPNSDDKKEVGLKPEDVSVMNTKNKGVFLTPSKSLPKGSSTPRLSRGTSNKKSKTPDAIPQRAGSSKNNKVTAESSETSSKEEDHSVTSMSAETEQPPQASKVLDDDEEEDILAGLPEVRISGTISNPASPTSSTSTEFQLSRSNIRSRQDTKKAVATRKGSLRKSTRETHTRRNSDVTEPYRVVSKPSLSHVLGSLSNTLPSSIGVDTASLKVPENDDEKSNKKPKQSVRKTSTRSTRKSNATESDPLVQQKPIDKANSKEHARQSPSIQSNGRTRESSKENVDCSSVFQVGKEAVAENAADEPAKRKALKTPRLGKRSLNTTDPVESGNAKKRKQDANVVASAATKGRASNGRSSVATRRHSANILNFVIKRSSPLNVEGSQQSSQSARSSFDQASLMSKQAVIKIERMSPMTLSQSQTENSISNTEKSKTRASINNQTISNNSAKVENEKAGQKVEARGKTNQRTRNKRQTKATDISTEVGKESQEVEMIMTAVLKEQGPRVVVEKSKGTDKSTTNRRGRNTRKRTNASLDTDVDITEASASSDVSESDNAHFEVPSSRAKRTRITKDSSNVSNSTINESTSRPKRSSRQSSRSTRSHQQSVTDSSVDESLENNADQSTASSTIKTMNESKKKGRRTKAVKPAAAKKHSEEIIEETTSSELNSSVDNTSIISTPTRVSRSMSSSFSMSSPFKVKHRILFTGIPSNDYSKFLTKLGASQVEDPAKCSVLVTDKVRRTVKFLCALAQSVPIVSVDWLIDSEKAGTFVELDNYILKDPAAEAKFGFKLRKSLEKAKEQKLLDGYTIVLTPNVAPPPVPELKSIIASCGGKALVRAPSSWPEKAVIISREEDLANAKKFRAKAPKTVTIQSTEFLLTGILRQELDFVKYKLT